MHPSELGAEWCGRFVPRPTLQEVVDGAVGLGTDRLGYNPTFLYPRHGGIEALVRALVREVEGPLDCGVEPTAIDWKGRTVSLSDGRHLAYDGLLSTIPLPELVRLMVRGGHVPQDVAEAAGRLRGNTVTYVNVGARGKGCGFHWVYFPEEHYPFYRAGSASAAHPAVAPEGCQSFYVEFAHRGGLSGEVAAAQAVEGLVRAGLLASEEDVLFAVPREIPNAYVLYDHDYGEARGRVLAFLAHAGILVAGRYGRWEYSAMEDAILAGQEAANGLRARAAA